jgi:hypothetical protein
MQKAMGMALILVSPGSCFAAPVLTGPLEGRQRYVGEERASSSRYPYVDQTLDQEVVPRTQCNAADHMLEHGICPRVQLPITVC